MLPPFDFRLFRSQTRAASARFLTSPREITALSSIKIRAQFWPYLICVSLRHTNNHGGSCFVAPSATCLCPSTKESDAWPSGMYSFSKGSQADCPNAISTPTGSNHTAFATAWQEPCHLYCHSCYRDSSKAQR